MLQGACQKLGRPPPRQDVSPGELLSPGMATFRLPLSSDSPGEVLVCKTHV